MKKEESCVFLFGSENSAELDSVKFNFRQLRLAYGSFNRKGITAPRRAFGFGKSRPQSQTKPPAILYLV
jgi:hypothetical protein